MFLTKEKAKENIRRIIDDDIDNDIVFITAHKGIGKAKLLQEICGEASFNNEFIVADGKKFALSAPSIKKCFAEGILAYLSQHNSANNRRLFCNNLGTCMSTSQKIITVARRKLNTLSLASILCSFSINRLKMLFFDIAGNTPLVIISTAMVLTEEEVCYLKELPNDLLGHLGARTTFIIGIRATPQNIQVMDQIIKIKIAGIWIMPLLPEIEKNSLENNPLSISSISIENYGTISDTQQLQQKIVSNSVYFETYEIIRHLCNTAWNPHQLFILANQEIPLEDYEYICDITKAIYKTDLSSFENSLILPNNGKLLWIDVLSYYLALQKGIVEAINSTQRFFLGIIREISTPYNRVCFGKPSRNAFISFMRDASSKESNVLAEGFSKYYSDFALLTRLLFSKGNCVSQDSIVALEVLDRVALDFNNENLDAIQKIYTSTQLCFVLDIGLRSITDLIRKTSPNSTVSIETKTGVGNYLHLCMREAYKWHDLTLIDEIVQLCLLINTKGLAIRYKYDEITKGDNLTEVYDYFIQAIKKYNLKVGDLIVPKKTIFLSYAQKNDKIANAIDCELQKLSYDVKRDIRDVEKWDSLKAFMQTIRKEDYVVFLVSDTYLHRDNCLYEVMQFLKDESYEKRAFPIAVNFSEEEKNQRLNAGQSTSMFDIDYIAEIVLFWQNRADNLKKAINQLSPENRAELDMKYREIANVAQNASEFLAKFFGDKLLMTMDSKHPQYHRIAVKIDEIINKGINT